MPEDNFLILNWQREVESLKKHVRKFTTRKIELIHKFRINIKKLKAYLKLYLLISKKKQDREMFGQTEKLFSVFGNHRNLELNKKRAKSLFPGNSELSILFISWLNEMQNKLEVETSMLQFNPSNLDELSRLIKENLHDRNNEDLLMEISAINEHYLKKAKKHMHHFSQNFHQVRKELKIIYYLSKISLPFAALSESKLQELEEILKMLGDIQDKEVLRDLLYQFRDGQCNEGDARLVETTINNLVLIKEQDLVSVQKKACKFIS